MSDVALFEAGDIAREIFNYSNQLDDRLVEWGRRTLGTVDDENDVIIEHLLNAITPIIIDGDLRTFLPGHRALSEQRGPVACPIMVIGKQPGRHENNQQRLFVGPSGVFLTKTIIDLGIPIDEVYYTNVCRFWPINGYKDAYAKMCLPILAAEINAVRPDFIWILGAHALKLILGSKSTLSTYRSSTIERGSFTIVVTGHPAEIEYVPEKVVDFQAEAEYVAGEYLEGSCERHEFEYTVIDTPELLEQAKQELLPHNQYFMDLEWSGRSSKSGDPRSVQISANAEKSYVICSFSINENGEKVEKLSRSQIHDFLSEVVGRDEVSIIGHNFKADLHTLADGYGIDLSPQYRRGADTMLMDHVLFPTRSHGLKPCTIRYTSLGNYAHELNKWMSDHRKSEAASELLGFGDIPDLVFLPYAATDPIATCLVYEHLKPLLDENSLLSEVYNRIEFPASYGLYQMERNGVMFSIQRALHYVQMFQSKRDEILDELQSFVRQKLDEATALMHPSAAESFRGIFKGGEFNPNSVPQVRAVLFDSKMLNLTPIQTSGKNSQPWEQVYGTDDDEVDSEYDSAGTGETTLRLLREQHPIVGKLLDFRILSKVLTTILKQTEDGKYQKGSLFCHLDPDERIRSTLLQLAETGRYTSSRPNMQNNPKRRESDYERIMGEKVVLRSVFTARPGYKLVEMDYKQAELNVLAWLSGDRKFETDVNDHDLHSKRAIEMFGLTCSEAEVKHNHKSLRICSKTVNFGIPYGRGARAIVTEIKKEGGPPCSVQDARGWIQNFYDTYPGVAQFIFQCRDYVTDPGYIITPWGRYRQFEHYGNEELIIKMQREAANYPIQGCVADALSVAINNFIDFKETMEDQTLFQFLQMN